MDARITLFKKVRLPAFLIILVLFLIAYPYLHQVFLDKIAIIEASFALLMISGISLLTERKRFLLFMVILAIVILAGIVVTNFFHNKLLLIFILLTELIFFLNIFISLLSYIYTLPVVTLNKIYAAITSYLVLGVLFAILYTIIALLVPEAFQYTASTKTPLLATFPHPAFFSEALYFSFVTLGTLGYGDWIPVIGPAKIIASLEAIAGQLFIAILIARLVGIQISQSLIKK